MYVLSNEQRSLVSGAGDPVRVGIDWDRDGHVDEDGWLKDGMLKGDSGKMSVTWEWDVDAVTRDWDFFMLGNNPDSALNQTFQEWMNVGTTGNPFTAIGSTVSNSPEILGNAADAFFHDLVDQILNDLAHSYDVWDYSPNGDVPLTLQDGSSPAINNPAGTPPPGGYAPY